MRPFWKSMLKWGGLIVFGGLCVFLIGHSWDEMLRMAMSKKAAANGRQIVLLLNEKEGHLPRYPGEFPPGTTAVAYIDYLVKEGFLGQRDRILFSVPGIPAAPPEAALADRFVGYTIFRVSPDDPPGTVFLITKPKASRHAITVVTKDGNAHTYKRKEALDALEQAVAAGLIPDALPLETKSP